MRRSSHRYRRSRSRSLSSSSSSSRSRSRDRHRHRKSHRNYDRYHRKHSTKSHHRHPRSNSPMNHKQHHYHKSNHPPIKTEENKIKPEPTDKSVKFDETAMKNSDSKSDKKEKQKEDFNASGALKRDLETTKNGVVLKYNEPPESTMSDRKWRLYVYKNDEQINLFHLHRKSFFLIGRDERVEIYNQNILINGARIFIKCI